MGYSKSGVEGEEALAPRYGTEMHVAAPIALTKWDIDLAMAGFLRGWLEVEEKMDAMGDEDKRHNRRCAERSLKHLIHERQGRKSIYTLTPPPEDTLHSDKTLSELEVPWAIDIGLDIPLVGRFDAFCQHRDTHEPWIWEFKTSGFPLNAGFFDAHEMYTQNLTYTMVGQTLLGEPVSGVMLEGMFKHATKVDSQCQPIPVTIHHLDDVLWWLQNTGQEILDAEKRLADGEPFDKVFYKNFCGCTPYTHFYRPGWRCDYADLCRVDDWKMLIGMYRVVEDHDFLGEIDTNAARKVEPVG
jgi:hypothetical protein